MHVPPNTGRRNAGRTASRTAALLLGLAAAAPAPRDDEPPATADPPADAKDDQKEQVPRVLVRVDRDEEGPGYVELEDDSLIVVRTHPYGEVRSFLKSRIAAIVRLVEPEPGQQGVLLLRTGQTAEGEILEDGFEHVIMIVEGIRMRFPRKMDSSGRPAGNVPLIPAAQITLKALISCPSWVTTCFPSKSVTNVFKLTLTPSFLRYSSASSPDFSDIPLSNLPLPSSRWISTSCGSSSG